MLSQKNWINYQVNSEFKTSNSVFKKLLIKHYKNQILDVFGSVSFD